uniref:Uncharacterized protein n=1 Tax=Acrobeloides nanus TaxID=290746 RepID=A0A914CBI9_9BILA
MLFIDFVEDLHGFQSVQVVIGYDSHGFWIVVTVFCRDSPESVRVVTAVTIRAESVATLIGKVAIEQIV